MIDRNYNEKFRKFFDKFHEKYMSAENQEEKDFLWDLAVDFVEKNRDFVMQYPITQYWDEIKTFDKDLEKAFLSEYNNSDLNLYFHIPFCKTRCNYCNFHIIVGDKNKELFENMYIKKIETEIKTFLEYNKNFNIKTIFIGGGTPSYLTENSLEKLLKLIQENFKKFYDKEIEISFEGNPDSFNKEKLEILKNYGVNRLSIGVQSFNNEIIKNINRTYTDKTVYDLLDLAKSLGFDNIGIDMIYGLPGHNYEIMKSDLEIASNLEITHLTYYPLYYYDEAILSKTNSREDNIKQIYSFYDEVISKLNEKGFEQYGREYFCKNSKISQYQNNFISNSNLYGFGHSAYSFNGKFAFKKETNLKDYLKNNDNFTHFFKYNDETKDRRLFILGSRNKIIKSKNISKLENIEKNIKMGEELNLLRKDINSNIILTEFGLKYQEVLSHIFM